MADLKIFRDDLERALLSFDREAAQQIVNRAVSSGKPLEIAGELISQTLRKFGDGWEQGNSHCLRFI